MGCSAGGEVPAGSGFCDIVVGYAAEFGKCKSGDGEAFSVCVVVVRVEAPETGREFLKSGKEFEREIRRRDAREGFVLRERF